jgi:hypothetical protein
MIIKINNKELMNFINTASVNGFISSLKINCIKGEGLLAEGRDQSKTLYYSIFVPAEVEDESSILIPKVKEFLNFLKIFESSAELIIDFKVEKISIKSDKKECDYELLSSDEKYFSNKYELDIENLIFDGIQYGSNKLEITKELVSDINKCQKAIGVKNFIIKNKELIICESEKKGDKIKIKLDGFKDVKTANFSFGFMEVINSIDSEWDFFIEDDSPAFFRNRETLDSIIIMNDFIAE